MVILDEIVVQFGNEGITTVDDLVGFHKDTIQKVSDSLRRPGGRIPDPTPNAAPWAKIPTPPFVFRLSHLSYLSFLRNKTVDLVSPFPKVGGNLYLFLSIPMP